MINLSLAGFHQRLSREKQIQKTVILLTKKVLEKVRIIYPYQHQESGRFASWIAKMQNIHLKEQRQK